MSTNNIPNELLRVATAFEEGHYGIAQREDTSTREGEHRLTNIRLSAYLQLAKQSVSLGFGSMCENE